MLVTQMHVHWNAPFAAEPDQCRRRANDSISIQPVNINAVAKWLPRNGIGALANLKKILQLQTLKRRGGIGFHGTLGYSETAASARTVDKHSDLSANRP